MVSHKGACRGPSGEFAETSANYVAASSSAALPVSVRR